MPAARLFIRRPLGAKCHANLRGLGQPNGKRLVQTATDIFVGWGSLHGKDYYVRQFRDMKIIPSTDLIAPRLVEFATACGETLARAHARTGDPVAIDGYIGKGPKFTAAIGRFARLYADQTSETTPSSSAPSPAAPSRADQAEYRPTFATTCRRRPGKLGRGGRA